MARRTITLSDRPPVCIDEDTWPVLASASDSEHDGQVECQANRKANMGIKVRQHADGRVIVNAWYSYDTHYQGEPNKSAKHGMLLSPTDGGASDERIVQAIRSVSTRMSEAVPEPWGDLPSWTQLADDCIADMPADSI